METTSELSENQVDTAGREVGEVPRVTPPAGEQVAREWSRRSGVTRLWAVGMSNPLLARAFWMSAYGTDAREFVYQWERLADEPAGTRVLDVPSGSGVALLGLAPGLDLDYTAVDISTEMIRRVRARAEREGLSNVRAVLADAKELPMPDGSFDLLLTYSGLHCFSEPWRALTEWRRVLADGGRIRGAVLVRRPGLWAPRVQRYFQWRGLLGNIVTWAEIQSWFAGARLSVRRTQQNGALTFFEGTAI